MDNEKKYTCTLTPLGEYFLGGERTFSWGKPEGTQSSYYIESNILPSQPTLFGVIRYIILETNGLLDDNSRSCQCEVKHDKQNKLIGNCGFIMDENCISNTAQANKESNYGIISGIGPLYIVEKHEDGKHHKLIPVPLNHKVGHEEKPAYYTPFKMKKEKVYTDLGEYTILPEDFEAKNGLAYDCYMDCADNRIIEGTEIFQLNEHTRVAVGKKEDGYFKKKYVSMKQGYAFQFEFALTSNENKYGNINTIVYLGQEKSAFKVECKRINEERNISHCIYTAQDDNAGYCVIYLLSDAYVIPENINNALYYCTASENIRTLTKISGNAYNSQKNKYKDSKKKSELFKLYKKGSVFYIADDKVDDFINGLDIYELQRIGLNMYIKLLKKKEQEYEK